MPRKSTFKVGLRQASFDARFGISIQSLRRGKVSQKLVGYIF